MADMRLHQLGNVKLKEGEDVQALIGPQRRVYTDVESRFDLALLLFVKDGREDLSNKILDDLYLGDYPLKNIIQEDGHLNLELLNSTAI